MTIHPVTYRGHWPLHPRRINPTRPDLDVANLVRRMKTLGWTARQPRGGEPDRSRIFPTTHSIRLNHSLWGHLVDHVVGRRLGHRDAADLVEGFGHELGHVLQDEAHAGFLVWYLRRKWRVYLEGQCFAWNGYVAAAYALNTLEGLEHWAQRFRSRSWWWRRYRSLPSKRQREEVYQAVRQAIRDGAAHRDRALAKPKLSVMPAKEQG